MTPLRLDGAAVSAGGPGLDAVAAVLAAGGVVGLPTDTVYGLAVDPARGTGPVFALKGRPAATAMAVLVAGIDQASALADLDEGARRLLVALWPGALTVVARRAPGCDWDLGGDAGTVGLRAPAHPVALAVLRRVGPIATTSANRHGRPPVTTADDLVSELPGVDVVVDGGRIEGSASTVVDVRGPDPRVLRDGPLSPDLLHAVWRGDVTGRF